MWEYNAKIINVVDGDTFDLDIDVGFHITLRERVRLLDINTPEKRGNVEKEAGLAVTSWAQKFIGRQVTIKSKKGTDSFGRWLVDLKFDDGIAIKDYYNWLGINKLGRNYSEENCFKLKEKE